MAAESVGEPSALLPDVLARGATPSAAGSVDVAQPSITPTDADAPAAPLDDPTIWCGIPVYNNAATIFDIARRCRSQITRVLVIDDGSTDADLTALLQPLDVTVIRHPVNLGKGRTLQAAFAHAMQNGAEYLITLDGDGQHFPEDLPRFFPHLLPHMIVIGYRAEVTGQMPKASRFGRDFSDFWIRLEAGGFPRDTQSGFRAYPLAAVSQLQLTSRFYNFEMEIITKAMWAGLRVHSVPIRVWYPPANQRVSSFDPLRDNLRIALLHTRLLLRQILPIPHRRLDVAKRPLPTMAVNTFRENSSPFGLALSAGLSILMCVVLWPWGIIAVGYVAIRLHLNKIAAWFAVVLCAPPWPFYLNPVVGRWFVRSETHPHLRWIAGSHIVAIPLAGLTSLLVYTLAARAQATNKATERK